jgi:SAM-dependent methyltransferase
LARSACPIKNLRGPAGDLATLSTNLMAHRPIPPALKRWLIPCWNAGHRFGWLAYDHANAVVHGRIEHCSVCGRMGAMLYRRRVIPPRLEELWALTPQLAEALARKESCDCARCGAKLRARRMAQVLLSLFPSSATSLARWVEQPEAQRLRVAEINRIDGLHGELARLPQFASSDYVPGASRGATVDGIPSEDLTQLTYADASFDLVLTSESLEHVPDLPAALREIRRVLVPDGLHVFTIPVLPHVPRTFARAVVLPDGSIERRAPRICHPGGDVGYPVFTEFGSDLESVFETAGFSLDVYFGPNRTDDLAQVYVCRKR